MSNLIRKERGNYFFVEPLFQYCQKFSDKVSRCIYLIFCAALFSLNTYGSLVCNETSKVVSLMVNGEGTTKGEAIQNALNIAIDQVYETVVSVNHELGGIAKDKAVTISYFKEIACVPLPNGNKNVTLQTMVKYQYVVANSASGNATGFAGSSFALDTKIIELKKKNELMILDNLFMQIKALLPLAFERMLTIEDPVETDRKQFTDRYVQLGEYYDPAEKSLRFKGHDAAMKLTEDLTRMTKNNDVNSPIFRKIFYSITDWLNSANDSYLMVFKLNFIKTDRANDLAKIIHDTLYGLSDSDGKSDVDIYYGILSLGEKKESHCFLNNNEKILYRVRRFMKVFYDYYTNFIVGDNMNIKSTISNEFDEKCRPINRVGRNVVTFSQYNKFINGEVLKSQYDGSSLFFMKGIGVFSPYLILRDNLFGYYPYWDNDWTEWTSEWSDSYKNTEDVGNQRKKLKIYFSEEPCVSLNFLMKKKEISKYSSFQIKDKHKW